MATINLTTKENCIEKICNLPLDFKVAGKSSLTLLQESNFSDIYKEISKQDIQEYLSRYKTLIDSWEIWSEDKRTWGYYLSIGPDKFFVGSLNKDGKESFSNSFATAEEACAEFILREVSAILDFKND